MSGQRSWDVFCRVIDNLGDAGVCWRLAQQLASEHGARVRLWIDELGPLHALCPRVLPDRVVQTVDGVEIGWWRENADFGVPADIAVEGFGCALPERYAAAMAQRAPASLWITLEYLSAEAWVAGCHGLPSPHPRLALERYFFFPGVLPGTGGLLREADLLARRDAFRQDGALRARFWTDLGFPPPTYPATVVSLFGYENRAVAELLAVWAAGDRPVVAAVPASRIRAEVTAFLGAGDPPDGAVCQRGCLELRFLPFLAQPRYDELLWSCDWNFVRGEDSFARAQWAAKPLVWHIYPQQHGAHWAKLDAFLDLYCAGLSPPLESALRAFWGCWNGRSDHSRQAAAGELRDSWRALAPYQGSLRRHAEGWADRLLVAGDLAGNLAKFCLERLK